MILDSTKKDSKDLKRGPGRPPKAEPIEAITKQIVSSELEIKPLLKPKNICTHEEHNCVAIQLTNRLICMIEEFENNIDRIAKHPSLAEGTKLDIQNYINKNLITAIWALAPAFDLMKDHKRFKTFKTIYIRSMNK